MHSADGLADWIRYLFWPAPRPSREAARISKINYTHPHRTPPPLAPGCIQGSPVVCPA
jgi:hypothetical protein